MPKTKLTAKVVDKLKAPTASGRQELYWDEELRGFGVLCSGATSAKTYIVQRDLPGGRTRRVTVAAVTETKLDEARKRAGNMLMDMRHGIDPKHRGERITLREALEEYIVAQSRLKVKSTESYRQSASYLGAWLDRPLREITPQIVEEKHRAIAETVAKRGRYSGEATANAAMKTLRAVWNHVEDKYKLEANPVRRMKKQWFDVPSRERLVRGDELPAFYKALVGLTNPVQRDYLLLMLFTGLRREEAAGLRWEDVDLAGGVVRLPAARTKAGRKLDVPITDFVRDLLVARRAAGGGEFVFPADSKSKRIAEPKYPLGLVADACGVKVSAHDLRRTYATVAAQTPGVSVFELKALMNHSQGGGDITASYVKLTNEALAGPAQLVCNRMRELCKVPSPTGANVRRLRRARSGS